jgi:hypothetical protein
MPCLSNESGSRSSFVFPNRGQLTSLLVITRKTVNTGFDKNQTILGILVLAVTFKMFADGDGLLDQVVQVFRDFGSKTYKKKDTSRHYELSKY